MSDSKLVKHNLDIVDLIGEYVQLKPAGNNHKGLCPFHNEKSPSFMVSRDRQSWRCFGCNKGGDIFTFVQEIEGLEFVEALKLLAGKAGITLTNTFSGDNKAGEKKVRLKAIMEAAVHFYHQFLLKMDASADARAYLTKRGLESHTIDVWKIGFVPDQWDLLTKYLLKKGFAIDDLVDAGLTIKRDGADRASGKGYYDRFRGRIMFPIWDVQGNSVGFTGRVLVETETSGGKYVNTPQTDIYDKSNILFGLDKAKSAMRTKDQVVIVEGQMDVITVWQSGMEQVVASSGTALTEQQIKLMSRYTKNIAMAFDTDAAGLAAAKRGIALALEAGMRVRVIQIPGNVAKDPDECIKKAPDVWRQSVREATDVLTWYISLALHTHKIETPAGKQAIADEVLPEIARIPYAVERDHWLGVLAAQTGIDRSVLKEDLGRFTKDSTIYRTPQSTQSTTVQSASITSHTVPQTQIETLLREWFALVLSKPEVVVIAIPEIKSLESLSPAIRELYELAKVVYTADQRFDLSQLETETTSAVVSELILQGGHHFGDLEGKELLRTFESLTTRVREVDSSVYRAGLIQALGAAEQAGDTESVREILSRLQ
jgi:DNA primase